MPQINILNILQGDNQSTIVDKINYNFDQILSAGGGPQGQKGVAGPTGAIGPQGAQGVQGAQGPSGTKWFVQNSSPALGNIQGSNPFLFPSLGDYWLDPDSAQQEIYVFGPTGWVDSGFGLAAGDIFQKLFPVPTQGGGTSSSIMMAGNSQDITLVISDSTVSQYSPGGTSIENLNFEDSKLKISSKDSRTKLISFGHSDFDIDPGGSAGTNSAFNPYFAWVGANPIGANFWDVELVNPTGAIGIQSLGIPASGGINMFSNGEISAQSTQENILLSTAAASKGTFVDASSGAYGFFEVGDSPTGANFPKTFLYVNSTGMGLGIGTGGFKLTGNDSRRLAVLGNVSISKTDNNHTTGLFVGTAKSSSNNNKGVLYVEGHAGFGIPNPTGYQGGVLSITGTSEAASIYPQVWITSPTYGPVLQIKNIGTATSTSRTVIGDGTYNSQQITVAADRVSGTGPDITQEFFVNGSHSFTQGPLLSFQHKLTNATNTTSTAPVFAITTSVATGTYNVGTTVKDTTIQTRNSNPLLILQANSTGQHDKNRVSLGTAGFSQLAVFPGPVTSSATKEYGTSVIGYKATGGARGLTGSLDSYANFSTATIPNFDGASGVSGGYNSASHALSILGVQTIGTTDPVSLLTTTEDTSQDFSAISMLKIHRNLGGSSYNYKAGANTGITGARFNSWPNGLEITSFRSSYTKGDPATANKSVALAVGATNLMTNTGSRTTCGATGFYVSDTGENVAIGATIDYTVALNVSGGTAILAKGAVSVTGANFSIVNGDINVSGGGVNVTGTEGINVTGGGSISVTGGGGINITGSGSLNVGIGGINVTGVGGINVADGNIDLTSGASIYIGGTGSINITGSGDINITGSGSINVGKGGINITGSGINLSGGSIDLVSGATLNVGGTGSINVSGSASINVTGTGSINITGGGSLNVSGGGGISVTGPGSISVATGGINVLGTGGIDMSDGGSLNIWGTGGINVTGTGNINVTGGGSINVSGGGAINVSGAGGINVTGGSISVTGGSINVTGGGNINVTGGDINVTGGDINITGGIYVKGATGINVTGGGNINVTGGDINVTGGDINITGGIFVTGTTGINVTGSGGINTTGGDISFNYGNLNVYFPGGNASFQGDSSDEFGILGTNTYLQITNLKQSTTENYITWNAPSTPSLTYPIPRFSLSTTSDSYMEMRSKKNPAKGNPNSPSTVGLAGVYFSDGTVDVASNLEPGLGASFNSQAALVAGTGGLTGGIAITSLSSGADVTIRSKNSSFSSTTQTTISSSGTIGISTSNASTDYTNFNGNVHLVDNTVNLAIFAGRFDKNAGSWWVQQSGGFSSSNQYFPAFNTDVYLTVQMSPTGSASPSIQGFTAIFLEIQPGTALGAGDFFIAQRHPFTNYTCYSALIPKGLKFQIVISNTGTTSATNFTVVSIYAQKFGYGT